MTDTTDLEDCAEGVDLTPPTDLPGYYRQVVTNIGRNPYGEPQPNIVAPVAETETPITDDT